MVSLLLRDLVSPHVAKFISAFDFPATLSGCATL